MKTAISVPDDIFERAERLARESGRSRSELYSTAMREYLASHDPNEVTASLDRVIADIGPRDDAFATQAGRHTLTNAEW